MKKLLVLALACLTLFSGCAVLNGPPVQTEAGTPGAERSTAPRLVVTSVSICQMTDRLGLDLAGVPDSSFDLPERYRDVPRIGLPMSPDMEKISTIKPDYIISPNALQYDLKPLYEAAGLPAVFMNLMSVEGMIKSIGQLGTLLGRETEAAEIISDYEEFTAQLESSRTGTEKPRVLVLMGLPGSYMVATGHSYVGNLVKLAGGENVFAGDDAFLNLNTEAISKSDPDIILRAAHGLPEEVRESFRKEFAENDIWKHFRAVQAGKVYDLDYHLFNMSAGLNYQQAVSALDSILYGDVKQ